MNIGLLKQCYGLLTTTENISLFFYFPDRLLGSYVFPARLTGAIDHDFLEYVLPDLLQGVDLQFRTHFCHARWCSAIFVFWQIGILEQLVSGTINGARWTNCMACFFFYLKPLRFLFLSLSEVYYLYYRGQ
jgi:hypothetical protein